MTLNWHLVKRCFVQCLLLAGPGVVIGTGLMGLVARWVLPSSYHWNYGMSMLFGSITAATDPVAVSTERACRTIERRQVVGLLNSLGASKKLTMVIAGESLMNDGIAIVGFTLFLNIVQGKIYTAGEVIAYLFQVALGGPAVGIACGIISIVFLMIIKNSTEGKEADNLANQAILTFAMAYLSFFVGEEVCEVSGVLACVTSGVMIAAFGWPLLTSRKELNHVWHVVEFVGNTIIFILSGVIIATDFYNEYSKDSAEAWSYLGYMVVVYLFMIIIRTVMMAVLYWPLCNTGYGFERGWKDAFISVWGGLRGAVGLILCLIVDEDHSIHNEGAPFVVLIGGATLLTLAINGTTCGFFLRILGMLQDPAAQKFIDHEAERLVHVKTLNQFNMLLSRHDAKGELEFQEANALQAKCLVQVLGDSWREMREKKSAELTELMANDSDELSEEEFLMVFRTIYLDMVNAEYWRMIKHQAIPITSKIPDILLGSIEVAKDEVNMDIEDWHEILKDMEDNWFHRAFDNVQRCIEIMHLFGRLTVEERNMHIVCAYVRGHKHAMEHFEDLVTRFTSSKIGFFSGGNAAVPSSTAASSAAAAAAAALEDVAAAGEDAPGDDNGVPMSAPTSGTGSGGDCIAQAPDPLNVGATCTTEKEAVALKALKSLKKSHERLMTLAQEKFSEISAKQGYEIVEVLQTKLLAVETLHEQGQVLKHLAETATISKKAREEMDDLIAENIHHIQTIDLHAQANDENFKRLSKANQVSNQNLTQAPASGAAPASENL